MVASEDYSGGKAVYVPAESKFSVGVQVPMLSLNANHGSGAGNGNLWFDDFDTRAAYRLVAAYEGASGLGVRGRYFNYDSGSPAALGADYFGMQLGSLEVTTGFSAGGWDLTGFAGVAGADIDFTDEGGGPFHNFDGTGFTLGIDAERELSRGFGLVAGARQTMFYGDTASGANIGGGVLVPVSELRAGASYTRVLPRGNKATFELGFESQIIHSLSVAVPNGNIDPEDVDISLAGPYFSFMFEF